jgi:putative transcriptional regulator
MERCERLLGIAAVVVLMAGTVTAQDEDRAKDLAAGKLLVAKRTLSDPNFAETVILLVQYDEEGTVGLIINRQSKFPLSRLAKQLEAAKGKSDPLYLGGPVQTGGIMALVRSRSKPEDAKRVVADIYIISSKEMLEKTMAAGAAASTFRLYVGYAGWANGQLEWELGMDAWKVLPADPGWVFDAHPETLWSRLVEQDEMRMAGLRKHAARPAGEYY